MSNSQSSREGTTPLDRAYALRLADKRDESLRIAIGLVEASAGDPGAALLVTRFLREAGRDPLAARAAERLVTALVGRGDLPRAVVAAGLLRRAEEREAALLRIAAAFGKGSERVGDVSLAPPPLPHEPEGLDELELLRGEELLLRAEHAIELYLSFDDPLTADSVLPELPLFSGLEPTVLARLLSAFEPREFSPGSCIVQEGEDGAEAFVVARGRLQVMRGAAEPETGTPLAVLGPGSIFGEMALVSRAPRAASVLAASAAEVLIATRAVLGRLAEAEAGLAEQLARFCHSRMVSNLLRHSPLFAGLELEQRAELMQRFVPIHFEAGQTLLQSGEQSAGLFLIASGEVTVTSKDDDGDTVVIAHLGPGQVVGEISLVLRRPANADVVAAHPTVALQLTHQQFQHSIREHPGMLAELYEIATQREEETRSLVAQQALDVEDVVLI